MIKSLVGIASSISLAGRRSIHMADTKAAAEELCDFINASPTPYHAVASAKRLLTDAGFVQLRERDNWAGKLEPGGKYFVTRNNSSIVALALEGNWRPGSAVAAVGAHTDSPCLKVKPVSKRTAEGYLQVAVETYGGGIWHTWFDRDLSVAGRVIVQSKDGAQTSQRFVHIKKPILRVPTLAIHLDRTANDAFKFNKETQLVPILGLVSSQLNGTSAKPSGTTDTAAGTEGNETTTSMSRATDRHHAGLIDLVSSELGLTDGEEVRDFELSLYDTQPSRVGGLSDEFVFSARLDNLGCTFTSIKGLVKSLDAKPLGNGGSTARVVACFDHEEIGSVSQQGADSNFLPQILARINKASVLKASSTASSASESTSSDSLFEESLAKSFLVSADMAHAVNPNYAAHYEDRHKPQMNAGVVVKINQNQRYATNSVGVALVQRVAELDLSTLDSTTTTTTTAATPEKTKVGKEAVSPLQLFVVRQDHPCGSTIGPMLSAQLGVRTCDVGLAQLDMHSCREVCGSRDVSLGIDFFAKFLAGYDAVWQTVELD